MGGEANALPAKDVPRQRKKANVKRGETTFFFNPWVPFWYHKGKQNSFGAKKKRKGTGGTINKGKSYMFPGPRAKPENDEIIGKKKNPANMLRAIRSIWNAVRLRKKGSFGGEKCWRERKLGNRTAPHVLNVKLNPAQGSR